MNVWGIAPDIKLLEKAFLGKNNSRLKKLMTDKPNQPREDDAVLGEQAPPPVNAVILGGIEGVKKRLRSKDEKVRIAALHDALNYGDEGLDLLLKALGSESNKLALIAYFLLQERRELKFKDRLKNYLPWFKFKTVTVNFLGIIIRRKNKKARYFRQNLGNDVTLDMVFIPGGKFLMGSRKNEQGHYDTESPQHWVKVPPFYMGKYPVTQAQWQAVMGNNPSYFKGANRPVEKVLWNDSVEFCEKLSKITGLEYRLPSEAEWEYACRAGTNTPFHFGKTITTDLANYYGYDNYGFGPEGVYREQTTEVGSFPPNAFGLYDMHGNVWEHCQDVQHREGYDGAPTDGSAWLSKDKLYKDSRIKRGGSWVHKPMTCRCSSRGSSRGSFYYGKAQYLVSNYDNDLGLRVVVSHPSTL